MCIRSICVYLPSVPVSTMTNAQEELSYFGLFVTKMIFIFFINFIFPLVKFYLSLFNVHAWLHIQSSWHADLNCLHIPLTPSAVLKAEVFQINMTSCSCDIIEMAVNVTDTCIDFCHMNPVYTHSFPASRGNLYK